MKVHFFDIKWDTDGEKVQLPSEVVMMINDEEMDISIEGADLLSDKFGWCVNSFRFDVSTEKVTS